MIFGAPLYLWMVHHHNPKSPSKDWGTYFGGLHFFFQNHPTRCSQQQNIAQIFRKKKNRNAIPINHKKVIVPPPFFSKKNIQWYLRNTGLKKQSFHAFMWNLDTVFLGEELLSFVVLRTLHALPPKSGRPGES